MKGYTDAGNMSYEDITHPQTRGFEQGKETWEVRKPELEPEIILHALTGWTAPKNNAINSECELSHGDDVDRQWIHT